MSSEARSRDKLTPTIRREVEAELDAIYGRARRNSARKMRRYGEHEATAALPETRPYTFDQILGDWEPAANHDSA